MDEYCANYSWSLIIWPSCLCKSDLLYMHVNLLWSVPTLDLRGVRAKEICLYLKMFNLGVYNLQNSWAFKRNYWYFSPKYFCRNKREYRFLGQVIRGHDLIQYSTIDSHVIIIDNGYCNSIFGIIDGSNNQI